MICDNIISSGLWRFHIWLKRQRYGKLSEKRVFADLSDAIVKFLGVSTEFLVLQICREELVLIPFGKLDWGLKKDVALSIPFAEIIDVEIRESALNYRLTIKTKKDVITLSVQQKGLSTLRSSGILGGSLSEGNWHSENLDGTLQALQELQAGQD